MLFQGHPALPPGPWDEPLHWLGLVADGISAQVESPSLTLPITLFPDGGYAVLRPATTSWALLRLPNYRFRPAHADPLHFDLWHQGLNLLRDGGSYAYNASLADLALFPGIASHNTVQFDGAEPMPRLSRFLWGDWLQLETPTKLEANSITAAYSCPHGRHQRQVQVYDGGHRWTIIDTCSHFKSHALLRWRLCRGNWQLRGSSLIGPRVTLQIQCDKPITCLELLSGWESSHYGVKKKLPILEVSVAQAPAILTTSIQLALISPVVKVLYTTSISLPAGAAGTRSYALALHSWDSASRSDGLSPSCPYSYRSDWSVMLGKRSGLVDGIGR